MSPDIERSLKLWVVLNRAVGSIEARLREQVEPHGLSMTEFGVLEVLYHKGALPIGEIGSRILLTSGSMTYVIDKLERRGLLQRAACPTDRRVTHAALTDAGRARIAEVFAEHAERIRELAATLSPEEQETATVLLRRLGLHARDAALDSVT